MTSKDTFWIAPLVVIGIGLLPMPYGYYYLLRLVVCVCAIYYVVQIPKSSVYPNDTVLVWVFGFFAILYNPIFPIALGVKALWVVINLITASVFFVNRDKS